MGGPDPVRVGVDVGGTFTDLVALSQGRLVTAKVPSTPRDQSAGALDAFDASRVDAAAVAVFAHGTTVATNALLERRGGRTALVTTEGFRDVLEIGRQNRPSLYDLARDRPPPLVPRDLRFTVRERMGPGGVITPLDGGDLSRVVAALAAVEVDAVAVCLLFGFLHPEHERRVGAAVRAALPGVPVSLSCEVLSEFREYERTATVAADAYLAPRVSAYLRRLADRARDRGLPEPLVMQSTGGVVEIAAAGPARLVLSGPAGGVVGASAVAARSGYRDLLTFDMGGTSTDVAPVVGGAVQTTTESVLAGVPLKLPAVDVHSVSAGGGSVAWVDEGGALRVGPRSAGAEPGPAAYGLGGEEPTVTDADLILGCLADGAKLGGSVTLSADLARRALARLGDRLGLSVEQAALGVVKVADTEMVRALRVISVERGLDPRDFALVAFGGAGGMHACALAEELGVRTVLVPRAGGVLSALGLAIADIRRDYVAPLLGRVDALDAGQLRAAWAELAARARADLAGVSSEPRLEWLADLRYQGQSYELTVNGDTPDGLAEAFGAHHERRYGHRDDGEPVEIVNVRLVAAVAGPQPDVAEPDPPAADPRTGRRDLLLDAGTGAEPADVLDRALMGRGSAVRGPAVVEFAESTCLVRPGWSGVVDDAGTLVLSRDVGVSRGSSAAPTTHRRRPAALEGNADTSPVSAFPSARPDRRLDRRGHPPRSTRHPPVVTLDPVTLSVMRSALEGIAAEMGTVLVRSAYSSNIKERRDCSAALFDARGRMIAQAEHIPVHLGAMPESVAAVMARGAGPGDVFALNDPYTGGTHLPDITLVSPIGVGDRLAGYAVTRAHHSDIGGMAPGSMPSDSRDLWQEGLVIPPVRLVREGRLDEDLLALVLANSRTPRLRRGDFRAQIAANQLGGQRVAELAERRGLPVLLAAYDEVLAYAERRTREALRPVPDGTYRARGELEGDGVVADDIPIEVTVTVDGDRMRIDLTGTADAVAGNVNCPLAVTRSACYFALRVLLPDDVPANAGTYAPLEIVAPEGSLANAAPPHAVVAGNVETSQRIADTVLAALSDVADVPAGGQGTMNNLVIGSLGWTYYETVAGGQGASRRGPGPSGVHVGMTNTLNTPVEALELEYPMRVERYELAERTGGAGLHRGGDGVIRSIRVLEPATVSLLTDRRRHPPAGARGGRPGAVGRNLLGSVGDTAAGREARTEAGVEAGTGAGAGTEAGAGAGDGAEAGARAGDGAEELPAKTTRRLAAGDLVTVVTPGGGGWGPPPSTSD